MRNSSWPSDSSKRSFNLPLPLALISLSLCLGGGALLAQDQNATVRSPERYGYIEIGSRGVKHITFEIDSSSHRPKVLEESGANNIGLVSTLQKLPNGDSAFSDQGITAAVTVIAGIKKHFETNGIQDRHIFVEISSGVAGKKGSNREHAIAQLRDAIVKATGLTVDPPISDQVEAQYEFDDVASAVKDQDRTSLVVIDVGGGNTKYGTSSYANTLQFGADTLNDKWKAEGADKLKDLASQAIEQFFLQHPTAKPPETPQLYVFGGAAYALTNYTHPEEFADSPKGIIPLTAKDIDTFSEALGMPNAELTSSLPPPKKAAVIFRERMNDLKRQGRDKAAAALKKFGQGPYETEQLRVAIWFLNKLVKRVVPGDDAHFYFYGDGQLAWIRRVVVDKFRAEARPGPDSKNRAAKADSSNAPLLTALERTTKAIEAIDQHLTDINSTLKALDATEGLTKIERRLGDLQVTVQAANKGRPTQSDLGRVETTIATKLDQIVTAIQRMPGPPPPSTATEPNPSAQDRAMVCYSCGIAALRRGDWIRARDRFGDAVAACPGDSRFWFFKAFVDLTLGDRPAAERSVSRLASLITTDVGNREALYRAAEILQGPARAELEEMIDHAGLRMASITTR